MENLQLIKQAPDVIATHRYEHGKLVATVYKSSRGEAEERYPQEENLITEANGLEQEEKPRRR